MDKKQLTEIISGVYKSLTPKQVSVFFKNENIVNIRVVSEAFAGITFSARFKILNQMLKDQQVELFNRYIYVFEAFTTAEINQLSKSENEEASNYSPKFKHSAQDLET